MRGFPTFGLPKYRTAMETMQREAPKTTRKANDSRAVFFMFWMMVALFAVGVTVIVLTSHKEKRENAVPDRSGVMVPPQ